MKKIKLLPIIIAGITTCGTTEYNLDKENSISTGSAQIQYDDNLESQITTSTATITLTTPTTTSSFTTTTVVTTTESIYKDIMFLYNIDNNYSLEDINYIIIKYSDYCNLSYDASISILKDNIEDIINYNSLEEGIMCTLFERGSDLGLLSSYCTNESKITKDIDRDTKEKIMIDMCDVMGIIDNDKKIILSIFRWETGNGTSNLCVNSNNYGGIRVYNGEFGIYQTPEYGMYRAILCIYNHICSARNNGCNDTYSIINHMSYAYCPGTASDWSNSINNMFYSVDNYYDFDSKYVKKYEN